MEGLNNNSTAAYCWFAKYSDLQGEENIVLEVRRAPEHYFLLHTSVRGINYHIQELKFMAMLEEFLSRLPVDASISIVHQVVMSQEGSEQFIGLAERISRDGSGDNVSVVYQLALTYRGKTYTSAPMGEDFTTSLDSLVAQITPTCYFKVCSLCNLLYIDGIYGGTDERRDLMYCFRDNRELLDEIRQSPRKSSSFPRHLLSRAMQDVDALHTCSSFALTEDFHGRVERAQKWMQYKHRS